MGFKKIKNEEVQTHNVGYKKFLKWDKFFSKVD